MIVKKDWLSNRVMKFTHNDKPIEKETVLSLAEEFTSSLSDKGINEVGSKIKEFEIFHSEYGWIRCYANSIN